MEGVVAAPRCRRAPPGAALRARNATASAFGFTSFPSQIRFSWRSGPRSNSSATDYLAEADGPGGQGGLGGPALPILTALVGAPSPPLARVRLASHATPRKPQRTAPNSPRVRQTKSTRCSRSAPNSASSRTPLTRHWTKRGPPPGTRAMPRIASKPPTSPGCALAPLPPEPSPTPACTRSRQPTTTPRSSRGC